jgi:hypothetical protein
MKVYQEAVMQQFLGSPSAEPEIQKNALISK